MKAVTYHRYGNPDVLGVTDVDEPKLGPDSVKVAVRAASINPVDWKVMAGNLDGVIDVFFPVIPAWDVAGVVEQPGPAVTEFAIGDEVIGYVRKDYVQGGTLAEKVAAPVRTLARKPRNLSWEQAAALPLAGLTAYQVLVHALKVAEGDTVLIHAAAGGVGSLAVQIAATRGARVIGTASAANHEFLRSLGAEPVEYGADLVDNVRGKAPVGVDAIFDLIGGDTLSLTPRLLADGGRVASIADPQVKQYGGNYVFVRPDASDLTALTELVEAGDLRIEVAESFPLSEAAAAYRKSMEGHTRGKIAITVSE
ncbi:NADP-dependent oxidoreductase [Saxibacter everestensis]|uniref:NADP-dependent oxidoreductase n=1 Tax=Saxibacter everestensis TaxID=2909229 RepID=A0ABY8QYL4_9MICO|nr:NADP-dependent oxidoreductase [Brevibacteriaceae bacterium ZFBP1038]